MPGRRGTSSKTFDFASHEKRDVIWWPFFCLPLHILEAGAKGVTVTILRGEIGHVESFERFVSKVDCGRRVVVYLLPLSSLLAPQAHRETFPASVRDERVLSGFVLRDSHLPH